MPSPLAHIGLALALRAAVLPAAPVWGPDAWRALLCVSFASIAPDLDVLPLLISGDGVGAHRGPSHSVLGAALIGLILSVITGLRGKERAVVVLVSALHVLLDWSTGEPGAPIRYGVPWAWPFSSERAMSSVPWFGVFHIDSSEGLGAMFSVAALPVYGRELLTVGVAGLLAWAVRNYR